MKISRDTIVRILALLVVIGLSVGIFLLRDRVKDLEAYGYPGIFLTSLLANATVLMPAPGAAIVFAMGAVFHPFLVAVVAGTGGAIGEMVGYLAGFSSQHVIERTDIYNRIAPYVKKYGPWGIVVLAAIPNPFFDLAGIAAGALKMPPRRFFLAVWVGQIIKMLLFAYAGSLSLNWLFPK